MGVSSETKVSIQRHHLSIRQDGSIRGAPFDVVVGEPGIEPKLDVLVIPGYSENKGSGINAAKALGDIGIRAVYPLLPLNKFPNNPSWYESVIIDGLQKTITDFDLFSDPSSVASVSHSAGGQEWGLARDRAPELFGNSVLLAPAGINGQEYRWHGHDDTLKQAILLARFARNAVSFDDPTDQLGTLSAMGESSAQIILDVLSRRLLTKFKMSAENDTLPDAVVRHATNHHVNVTVGLKDVIVPQFEALNSLIVATNARRSTLTNDLPLNLEFVLENVPHLHLRTKQGVKQIRNAGLWLLNFYSPDK